MPRVAILSDYPGSPVGIDVKDRTLYAHEAPWADLIEQLDEQAAESAYERVQADFWQEVAPQLAREHGYKGEVHSEGRSGGWLVLSDRQDWTAYIVDRDMTIPPADDTADEDTVQEYDAAIAERTRFMRFAEAVDAAIDRLREQYADDLRDLVDHLNARREACLVRGEN